jgi:hypothetical protein
VIAHQDLVAKAAAGVEDEETASEIEESFAVHIAIIAPDILKREIGMVLVLPKQLIQ